MILEEGYVTIKIYQTVSYNDWETLAELPSLILKGNDKLNKTCKKWEVMFEQWHQRALSYNLVNESLLIKEDYLDNTQPEDTIDKDDVVARGDSIEDFPKVIYLECALNKIDNPKQLIKRMGAVLRSSAIITEFSQPIILTNINQKEYIKDGIDYNPELLYRLNFKDSNCIMCASFTSREDPSAKSVVKFLEDMFWKTMPSSDYQPYMIGVFDTLEPNYHMELIGNQMQNLGVAVHRDADVKIEDLREFIKITEPFNMGTFFLRDFLRLVKCPNLLEQNMNIKILLNVLDVSNNPWFDVKNVEIVDLLSNVVITPEVLDAADKRYLQDMNGSYGFFDEKYNHYEQFRFLKKKLAGDITKANLTTVYYRNATKSIFVHYAIGTYYYPINEEYKLFGCFFEFSFLTMEEKEASRKRLLTLFSGDKEKADALIKRIEENTFR